MADKLGDYANIERRIWNSKTFRSLSESGRMLYLYLLTCEHSNLLKCFVCRKLYMAADLGWTPDRVTKALDECQAAKLKADGDLGLIVWDEETELVLITNGLIKDKIGGPKQIEAAVKVVNALPSSPGIFSLLLEILEGFESAFDPLRHTLSHRVSDTPSQGVSIPTGNGNGIGNGEGPGEGEEETSPERKPTAKERRLALFAEVQAAYPPDHGRNLAGETTGRNAYLVDLQHAKDLGFPSEADLHAHVLAQLERARDSDGWTRDEGKYIPGIGKFLKDKHWRRTFTPRDGPSPLSEKGQRTAANAARVLERLSGEGGCS